MSNHLRLNELEVRFNETTPPVLSGVNLSVRAGECHCIAGPTGSGKSTLLRAVAGLLPPDVGSGKIELSSRPGVVFQNPRTQVLFDHVGKETAFALENQGTPPDAMPEKVTRALAQADLDVPAHTPTAILSMGRQYRLILAGALVTEPDLLLLDEPCAQLDPEGCAAVARVIGRFRDKGGAVLLCEHDPTPLADQITHWWRIEDAALRPSGPPENGFAPDKIEANQNSGTTALLDIRNVGLTLGDKTIFSGLDLAIAPGEAIHVEGPNGTGKSTLTRIISGFLKPDSGSVALFGKPVQPAALRGRVGLVLQSPLSQLFEDTVERELVFAARRKGQTDAEDRARDIAGRLGIGSLLDRPPHLLSYGTQRLVALGACLTQAPDLLILDDPFAGLDRPARDRIRELLREEREKRGMAVLVTGHNPPSPLRFADFYTRELRLEGGRLAAVA
ncbi:ATP-binding cassette domain-containing protein [Pseudodesulfovibrio cashew]|uniref:ATP-binding cassette domain-containing protein n=1 Tax=Pseudodesulfovibrio cashew TaxID=2678688 RepID=A0A6I6JL48_9BACT|nr:ABC transporter ATP-binding protein [Pseudodesulfovibrio cashew]QGY41730.1 ATP-binding cassette domain-containing protein [Pseudodesulfovibrio cashew]